MTLNIDNSKAHIDKAIRQLQKDIPSADLHEIGALLISAGCFLVCTFIPDLKAQLIEPANIAHQLLHQEKHESHIQQQQ